MPHARDLRSGATLPEEAVRLSFARSGGPGGQNVNKVETKVVARLAIADLTNLREEERARLREKLAARLTDADELIVTSSLTRSRERNITDALDRMAEVIRRALHRPKKRRPTRPTRASKERRLQGKKRRSETKRRRRPPSSE